VRSLHWELCHLTLPEMPECECHDCTGCCGLRAWWGMEGWYPGVRRRPTRCVRPRQLRASWSASPSAWASIPGTHLNPPPPLHPKSHLHPPPPNVQAFKGLCIQKADSIISRGYTHRVYPLSLSGILETSICSLPLGSRIFLMNLTLCTVQTPPTPFH